jgi:hypothetical protein
LAISIICFISSALGAILVEVVVVAGLDAVVVVVVVAGLEAAGAFGAADGVWAIATEAIANRVVSDKVVGLMVAGIVLRETAWRQASRNRKVPRFLLLQQS